MVTEKFAKSAKEVNFILSYMPVSDVNKIPIKFRNFLNNVEDNNYVPNINPYISIEEQILMEKTKDILAIIYRNYFCNAEERNFLDKKMYENQTYYNKQLKEKYNSDVFKKRTPKSEDSKKNIVNNTMIIQYENKSIFDKIKNFFKKII